MTYRFIDAIKDRIVAQCPGQESATRDAIDRWERDLEPRHPYDRAVYAVCETIRNGIEGKDE